MSICIWIQIISVFVHIRICICICVCINICICISISISICIYLYLCVSPYRWGPDGADVQLHMLPPHSQMLPNRPNPAAEQQRRLPRENWRKSSQCCRSAVMPHIADRSCWTKRWLAMCGEPIGKPCVYWLTFRCNLGDVSMTFRCNIGDIVMTFRCNVGDVMTKCRDRSSCNLLYAEVPFLCSYFSVCRFVELGNSLSAMGQFVQRGPAVVFCNK